MLLTLFAVACLVFVVAYKFYGDFQSRVYGLNDNNPTPSQTMNDGMDYVPAHPAVLLGHHFASIAGAGPVVGPIAAAAMFGWLPAYLWILIGCVFFGGVHDMGSIVASFRHKGLSIGEVINQWIGPKAKRLFLIFTWLALTLVIAVFLELATQTFVADPAVAFSACLYMVMAMIFGILIYRCNVSLKLATIVMLPILFYSLVYGNESAWVQSAFKLDSNTWRMFLVAYIFAASVMPVWLLLQPRDYLASYLLYASLIIGGVGMLFGGSNFEVKLPAFTGIVSQSGEYIWPLLFVTVACGAISGFHSLVGSGTSSKQIGRESDAVPVGYGAMLIEGIVGVIALGTLMMTGVMDKGGPTVVYANGLGEFAKLMGIPQKLGVSFALLALNSFILTSLDTATRLARYQLQEFTDMKLGKYSATGIGVAIALALVFVKAGNTPVWALIWPVFGASNQLVAAMALLALGVWIKRDLKKDNTFVMYPMYFMLITTVVALVQLIVTSMNKPIIAVISAMLLVLAMMLCKEAMASLKKLD